MFPIRLPGSGGPGAGDIEGHTQNEFHRTSDFLKRYWSVSILISHRATLMFVVLEYKIMPLIERHFIFYNIARIDYPPNTGTVRRIIS